MWHLDNGAIGQFVGSNEPARAVHFDPLHMRLQVAEDAAGELHAGARHRRLIGREAGLEEGPVSEAL